LSSITEKRYQTRSRGDRKASSMRLIGKRKYLLLKHSNHTHFIYQLSAPKEIGSAQKTFNLQTTADFLIQIKNPIKPSPSGVGLSEKAKAKYPDRLQQLFKNQQFISLFNEEFLAYKGAELLIIEKETPSIEQKSNEVKKCLTQISQQELDSYLEKIAGSVTTAPIAEGKLV
jgi:hypothetical protein